MERKYEIQKDSKHTALQYPKTLKAFSAFVLSSSATAACYGIITSPSMTQASEEILTRDSSGNILLLFGAFAVAAGLGTIKNFKLERKQKKLQAKLTRQEAMMNAEEDIRQLYERIESQKRFDNITEQTKGL